MPKLLDVLKTEAIWIEWSLDIINRDMSENAFPHSSTWWMEFEQISPCESKSCKSTQPGPAVKSPTRCTKSRLASWSLLFLIEELLCSTASTNWRSISSISCRIWGKKHSPSCWQGCSSPKQPRVINSTIPDVTWLNPLANSATQKPSTESCSTALVHQSEAL